MNKKKLSIIIPVYNCELYIGKLLNQLDQLDKDLVEIIIVNDGSTDNSYNILKNFQNKISNLNIITQTNHGVSYTRNVGIKHSSGDFIFFIDSDDEVIISSLTKLIDSLQTYEVDLVIFGLIDRFLGRKKVEDIYSCVYSNELNKNEFLKNFGEYLNNSILYSPCNKLYRRDIIINNNIEFETHLVLGEDILFNLSYFKYCERVKFIDQYVYIYNHYYDRKNTGSTQYLNNELEIFVTVLSNIELFLENEKVIHINRNNLNRFYIKRMNSLVSSLFSKTCTLNAKEKKLQIKKICQTSIFKNACLASIPNLEKKK